MASVNFCSTFDLVKACSVYKKLSDAGDTCAAVVIACLTEKEKIKTKNKAEGMDEEEGSTES